MPRVTLCLAQGAAFTVFECEKGNILRKTDWHFLIFLKSNQFKIETKWHKPFIRNFQTQLNSYGRKKQGKARTHLDLSRFEQVERVGKVCPLHLL